MESTSDARRRLIENAVMRLPVTDDPRPVAERLADYAKRGQDAPESLSFEEIRQLSFALSVYLDLEVED